MSDIPGFYVDKVSFLERKLRQLKAENAELRSQLEHLALQCAGIEADNKKLEQELVDKRAQMYDGFGDWAEVVAEKEETNQRLRTALWSALDLVHYEIAKPGKSELEEQVADLEAESIRKGEVIAFLTKDLNSLQNEFDSMLSSANNEARLYEEELQCIKAELRHASRLLAEWEDSPKPEPLIIPIMAYEEGTFVTSSMLPPEPPRGTAIIQANNAGVPVIGSSVLAHTRQGWSEGGAHTLYWEEVVADGPYLIIYTPEQEPWDIPNVIGKE